MAKGRLGAGEGIAVWNVVFQPGGRLNTGHVLAYGWDHRTCCYVVVDPLWDRIEVQVLSIADFDAWRLAECGACRTLRIRAGQRTSILFPGLWCVGVVKRLIGLRSSAFTVPGLRRDLLRAGAQEVRPREGQGAQDPDRR